MKLKPILSVLLPAAFMSLAVPYGAACGGTQQPSPIPTSTPPMMKQQVAPPTPTTFATSTNYDAFPDKLVSAFKAAVDLEFAAVPEKAGIAVAVYTDNTLWTYATGQADETTATSIKTKDKVMKVSSSGEFIGSFTAPADNIGAITLSDGAIYLGGAKNNSCPPYCGGASPGAKLYKTSMEGELLATYNISFSGGNAGDITGLTNDGTELIVANDSHHGWFLFDVDQLDDSPYSSNSPDSTKYADGGGGGIGFESLVFIDVAESQLSHVYALKSYQGSKLIQFDKDGSGFGNQVLQGADNVKGLAYLDVSCSLSPTPCSFLFMADGDTDTVRDTVLSENVPELSSFGSYGAQLSTTYDSTEVTSDVEAFNLIKATSVDIVITSPASGVTVDTSPIVVSFTVDDPSVTQVVLGAELATGVVFGDSADDGEVSKNKWSVANSSGEVGWHIDCDSKSQSNPCAWHYASEVPGDGDFNAQDQPSNGTLQIAESIVVKSGTALAFEMWYNTETYWGYDQKWVEVNIVDDDPDLGWQAIVQIVGPGESADAPNNAYSSFFSKPMQPANASFQPAQFGVGGCPPSCEPTFAAIWEPVYIDLESAFPEDTELEIRFRFDTVDGAVNQMEGWYIENVAVTGESSAASDAANVVDGVASFEIAEGSNSITIQALIPYEQAIYDADTIIVFLDTIEPQITMDQDTVVDPDEPDIITSATNINITGSYDELNATFLKMSVTTVVGTTTPFVNKNPDPKGDFNINLALAEGNNLVTVEVTDGAGRLGSASALIFLDTLGPTYTPLSTVYPVGVLSARPGDPIIFQINAGDAASDVQCVEVLFNSAAAQSEDPCKGEVFDQNGDVVLQPFVRPEDIPEAVRDSWGTSGQWLFPSLVPSTTLPGTFGIPVRIADSAGNATYTSVTANITPSLSAINIGLMPGENLVSLPLIPDDRAPGNLSRLLAQNQRIKEITEAIWYYDSTRTELPVEDRWLVYTPAEGDVDDLLELNSGRGYWWITDEDLYSFSAPLPGLSQQTPQVENFAYTGVFLRRGAEAPPVYSVVSGWNLVGLHSEKSISANEYLSALGRGDAAGWSSLLRFDNFIEFPIGVEGDPSFELGHFTRVFSAEEMDPTQGFWLFSTEDGVITP